MRNTLVLASSAIVATILSAGFASADDHIHVTAPITREHARAIQATHPAGELTVVPMPVAAGAVPARFAATTARVEIADR